MKLARLGRLKFYASSIVAHAVLVLSLASVQSADGGEVGSAVLRWISIAAVWVMLFVFYLRPDILLMSYRTHIKICERSSSVKPLGRGAFYLAKIAMWFYILCWPPVFLIIAEYVPLLPKVYLGLALLATSVFNGGFLFATYDRYIEALRNHRWGVLATH